MRWQRWARLGIVVVALGFVALLVARYQRRAERPAADVPAPLPKDVTYQARMQPGSRQCRIENGQETACISYEQFQQFTDGHREVTAFKFQGERDGKPFTITADRAELRAAPTAQPNDLPNETHLVGHVVVQDEGGLELRADDATYLDAEGRVSIPGALTYSRGRMSGGGTGAEYIRAETRLRIFADARVSLAPDEGGQGRLDGQAQAMELDRARHFLDMRGDTVLTRDAEVLKADTNAMHLTESEDGVQLMELRGRASVEPNPGATAPSMRATDIDLEFHPDGRTIKRTALRGRAELGLAAEGARRTLTGDTIDAELAADGATVTSLSAMPAGNGTILLTLPATADAPGRVIRAGQMTASGNSTGLTTAKFVRGVQFSETPAAGRGRGGRGGGAAGSAARTATSRQLSLALNGDLGDISEAHFLDTVEFHDADTVGKADDLTYRAAANRLVLRPSAPSRRSSVTADRIKVDARDIDIDLGTNAIRAAVDVRSVTQPDPARGDGGLFDAGKPVSGQATELLEYDDQKQTAVYTGKATLWQPDGASVSRVQGDVIRVDSANNNLTAEGHVTTSLSIENVQTGAKTPVSKAAKLVYVDAERRATYTGTATDPAEVAGPDGIVRAAQIDLILSSGTRELQTLQARRSVVARVAEEQTARGESLDYDAKAGRYILDGNPARLIRREVQDGKPSCTQTLGQRITYVAPGDGRTKSIQIGAGGSGAQSTGLPNCTAWEIK
jgi:lipopolysaccharide export system protein LptA